MGPWHWSKISQYWCRSGERLGNCFLTWLQVCSHLCAVWKDISILNWDRWQAWKRIPYYGWIHSVFSTCKLLGLLITLWVILLAFYFRAKMGNTWLEVVLTEWFDYSTLKQDPAWPLLKDTPCQFVLWHFQMMESISYLVQMIVT